MSRYLFAIALLSMPLAGATAQGDEGPPRWAANLARKQQVIMHGLPKAYGALRDPMPDTSAKLRRGAYIFEQRCSSCHGWNGHGAGPEASPSSRPPPTSNGSAPRPRPKRSHTCPG